MLGFSPAVLHFNFHLDLGTLGSCIAQGNGRFGGPLHQHVVVCGRSRAGEALQGRAFGQSAVLGGHFAGSCVLQPQQTAGAQLLAARQPVFDQNSLLAHPVLLGHVENSFTGQQHVILHGSLIALAFQVVGTAGHSGVESRQLVVVQELAQTLVAPAGQVGGGFAGQRDEGAQVVETHFSGISSHDGHGQQFLAALQALIGHNAGRLGDVAHGHDERVRAVGRNSGG